MLEGYEEDVVLADRMSDSAEVLFINSFVFWIWSRISTRVRMQFLGFFFLSQFFLVLWRFVQFYHSLNIIGTFLLNERSVTSHIKERSPSTKIVLISFCLTGWRRICGRNSPVWRRCLKIISWILIR